MSHQRVDNAPKPPAPASPPQQSRQAGQQAIAAWEKAMKKSKGGMQDKSKQNMGADVLQGKSCVPLMPGATFMGDTSDTDSPGEKDREGGVGNVSAGWDSKLAESEESGFDAESLIDNLASMSANSNMFEVVMPGGAALGIVVHEHARHIDFLMSTSDRELEKQLKRQKSVIQHRLGSRLGKEIGIEML